jgi:hypothetical protein
VTGLTHCDRCQSDDRDIRHFVRTEPNGEETVIAMCWPCRVVVEREMREERSRGDTS